MDTVTIGIDLGTTNTLACYMKKGKPTLIRFDGESMLASLLYVDKDGHYIIGAKAGVAGVSDPDHLIRSSKTFMGDADKKWEYRGKTLTPMDVAAEILSTVKAAVLKRLKKESDTVVKAVITVPAYFSGKQKSETRKAGERAGLEVLRIISEPMAAAVAAGRSKDLNGKILVVDLGGGTFDLCILEAENYRAIATDGDHHLGGDDFDRLLYQYFLERLGENAGLDFSSREASGLSVGDYGSLRGRLILEVEKTKKALSESTEKEVSITNLFPYKGGSYTFDIIVDRDQFDEICEGIYKKITTRLENFLKEQPFSRDEIDSVILAGGSCYIPRIRTDVEKIVHRQADTELDLEKLVVIGACIIAEYEAGGIEVKGEYQDIISHSMGVEIADADGNHVLSKILLRGEPYPCENTRSYTTSVDNQTMININIYEAGSDAEDTSSIDAHNLFGSTTLDVPPGPKGKADIRVTFSYDKNQTLKVTAEDQKTKVRKQILIRENEKAAIKPRQMPVDFMLLLDTSGSMDGMPLKEAKKACNALVNEIIDFSVHRLGIVAFETQSKLVCPLGNDRQSMNANIESIIANGGTYMVKAFREGEKTLDSSTNAKVIIMVSDGEPLDAEADVLRKANSLRKDNVRIIAIGVGNGVNKVFLKQLVGDGLYYTINNMNELEGIFRTAIPAIMEKM